MLLCKLLSQLKSVPEHIFNIMHSNVFSYIVTWLAANVYKRHLLCREDT